MTGQLDASTMLSIAIRDFNDLSKMADPEDCSDALFGFLVQQTAEKAFKAWIAVAGEVYPFTHDVVSLIDILKRLGEEIPDAFANLDQFSDFGVRFAIHPTKTSHRFAIANTSSTNWRGSSNLFRNELVFEPF